MLLTKILFPISESLKTTYYNNYTANLFEENNIIIKPFPGDYKPIYEGESYEYIDGISSSLIKVPTKRYGFELTTKDGRMALIAILQQLIADAIVNPEVYNPITCYDYVNTELSPLGYKERKGIITEFEVLGGFVQKGTGDNERRVGMGVRFKFMEIDKRFLG